MAGEWKKGALVCRLILCMTQSLRFPFLNGPFHLLLGDIFSFSRRNLFGWLGANSVCLSLSISSSCFFAISCVTGAVARSDWNRLIMTMPSLNYIISIQRNYRIFVSAPESFPDQALFCSLYRQD